MEFRLESKFVGGTILAMSVAACSSDGGQQQQTCGTVYVPASTNATGGTGALVVASSTSGLASGGTAPNTSATGGVSAVPDTIATGGATAVGTSAQTSGGATAPGSTGAVTTVATGGAIATGGATGVGGTTATGGATAIGGATGVGGVTSSAGGHSSVSDAGEECDGGVCECVTRIQLETGECAVPIAISVSDSGVCVLLTGGNVACWGGQASSKYRPKLIAELSGATAIVAGAAHTCAVLSDHSVNCLGTLGGAYDVSNAVALSAGNTFTCALLSDGTAKCWGSNDDGKLGDNTQLSRRTPVSVVGLSNATAIGGGFDYNCALISDGTMKCWGNNANGQLGNGTYADGLSATPVSGLEGVESLGVTGYADHNCAVLSSGQLACWGLNAYGQLGDATTVSSLVPVLATGVTGAFAVAQSSYSTCAVLQTGSVECWGYDLGTGSLGNGTTTTSPIAPVLVPTKVIGVTQATAIAAGQFFYCAIADGTVKCWGQNSHGQLGTGDTTSSNVAVPVLW